MAYLRAALLASALASLAACGGNGGGNVDALIIIPDAPIDARPIDAPPDAPSYNFTCAGMALPTTAPATITVGGTTQELSGGGGAALGMVDVQVFRAGTTTPLASTTSDAAGAWTSGPLATNGVPLDGSIRAAKANYRTTYVFPPQALSANLPNAPVLMLASATFNLLAGQFNQDDANNGALMIAVTDCANMPVPNAVLSVKQGGTEVGTQFSLGTLSPQAAGVYFVFNVPAGPTVVSASYMNTTFLAHTVTAFKKADMNDPGSTTATIVRPGPL